MPEPGRHADADIADDLVLPFRAEASGVMGRLVRLGPAIDDILTRHGYPEPVSLALGEAIALAAMLGAALKVDAKFTLQTKCDGPLSMLLVNYESPGALRGLASFDAGRLGVLGDRPDGGALLGRGHLAMTIDPGGNRDRYQGIVALDGVPLAEAALAYFRQSEQLPTFIRLAVARHFDRDAAGSRRWHWRAGGLMLQHLSAEGGDGRQERDRLRGDGLGFEPDDDWERTRILAATVEDIELIDPDLAPERLLFRLFHEEGVRAYGAKPLEARCSCSRQRLAGILRRFTAAEKDDMIDADGSVIATCEYCSASYAFARDEL